MNIEIWTSVTAEPTLTAVIAHHLKRILSMVGDLSPNENGIFINFQESCDDIVISRIEKHDHRWEEQEASTLSQCPTILIMLTYIPGPGDTV